MIVFCLIVQSADTILN